MTAVVRRCGELALLLGVLLSAAYAWASSPPALRFDPFREPPERPGRASGEARTASDRAFEPVLRSTVIGGERPLANLGGEILAIGEAAHGYRLIEVRAFDAVFLKDGARVRLEVESAGEAGR